MSTTTTGTASRLRFLDHRKPTWRRPDDAVVEEVIVPSLQVADRFDCMVGYFGGAALRELSHGLAAYILRSNQPLRLPCKPLPIPVRPGRHPAGKQALRRDLGRGTRGGVQ